MPARNSDAIRESFARQAAAFEDPARAFAQAEVMKWMAANTPSESRDVVLEVAAGTALFGRAVARHVAAVFAVDLTPEMLAEGRRAVAAERKHNVVFLQGDATALPFRDGSVDRLISRLAIHHFEDPTEPLNEMIRVCRPGGTVTVIDMVFVEDRCQDLFNDLERRRDPAHTRALTRDELRRSMEAANLRIVHTATRVNVLDGERWLAQTSTPAADAEHIRRAWHSELRGGPGTGMAPRRKDDSIEFVHHWDLLVGERRAHSRRPGG